MTYFLFQPDKDYEVLKSIVIPSGKVINEYRDLAPMSFLYNSKIDMWRVLDPKSNNFITFMVEGVPEIYRAQVLLLVAAYPD